MQTKNKKNIVSYSMNKFALSKKFVSDFAGNHHFFRLNNCKYIFYVRFLHYYFFQNMK